MTENKPRRSVAGFFRANRRLILAAVLALAAVPAYNALWQRLAPRVIHQPQYLVRPENVSMTPNPDWVTADVLTDVLRSSGLAEDLSVLDPRARDAVEEAFLLHPWIASVDRIEKRYPPALHVDVTFRRPVAVVEVPGPSGAELLPIDGEGTLLPAGDVPEIRRRYLPRVGGIVGRPPVGQRWPDPRVIGAAELASLLADQWQELHLVDILPSARPEVRGNGRYYLYDFVTRGGTRIVWGAAPSACPSDEDPFPTKLDRLLKFVRQNGPLNSVRGPQTVDVRHTLEVTARTAKLPGQESAEETTTR